MPEEAKGQLKPHAVVVSVKKFIEVLGIEIFIEAVLKCFEQLRQVEDFDAKRVLCLLDKIVSDYKASPECDLQLYSSLKMQVDRRNLDLPRVTLRSVEDLL